MKKLKKLFILEKNPILYPIVYFFINNNLLNNHGKFKKGDKVTYNFFARIVLGDKFLRENHEYRVLTVSHYEPWSKDKESIVFDEDSGCSVFWIRKLYPWENPNNNLYKKSSPTTNTKRNR